jgi:hypothetical protein
MKDENDNSNRRLIGLPDGDRVRESFYRLCGRAEELGVNIDEDFSAPNHARFIGIFEGRTIILYPRVAPLFALWFTVAHLYGHMTQLLNETPRVERANELVLSAGKILTPEDVQLIYDHEREAAEIGRRLIAGVEPELSPEMDAAYTRFFHADFRYLINFIETGAAGVEVFERYWRHEPNPGELITADSRELSNMKNFPVSDEKIVVV